MPEGPEIRRAADKIAKVLVDEEIVEAWFAFPELQKRVKQIEGDIVTSIDTRGKAILTRFSGGLTLYTHNQLYGIWVTAPRDQRPETRRSLRVALHTRESSALLYSASEIELLTSRGIAQHRFLNRVGPDVLDPQLTSEDILGRLTESGFSNRSLVALYLDQSFIGGIGNYLRSEILHCARVHPTYKPSQLPPDAQRRLASTTLSVSRRSYRTRGVTVTRALARSLRLQGQSFQKYRFWVFGRSGLPCHNCGTSIEKITAAGRRLYFCPTCQPSKT